MEIQKKDLFVGCLFHSKSKHFFLIPSSEAAGMGNSWACPVQSCLFPSLTHFFNFQVLKHNLTLRLTLKRKYDYFFDFLITFFLLMPHFKLFLDFLFPPITSEVCTLCEEELSFVSPTSPLFIQCCHSHAFTTLLTESGRRKEEEADSARGAFCLHVNSLVLSERKQGVC